MNGGYESTVDMMFLDWWAVFCDQCHAVPNFIYYLHRGLVRLEGTELRLRVICPLNNTIESHNRFLASKLSQLCNPVSVVSFLTSHREVSTSLRSP